ncbi:bifunctional heptose 7-phosphate kinase/heptose 1-phosphate adenyltransferase [uncultured Megasphaera sp.]|uniref:bifunctional heptose 7-phosphate kinase/heptose 1-phosphate adenyltransferase n=1 Tax=uncultured Megasphaera sp. TaxID=165188 RepID=UPI00259B0F08|nr:bifunctional heptose 7-phosphate kinase/heptose 1-phosphate adenyltransferase [uncultured Megasphaera sp.]
MGQYIDEFLKYTLSQLRIAVIGDVMLDKYVFGKVQRISPEAPVPVNKVECTKAVLGGAANVAANLAFLHCKVALAGTIGDDENACIFSEIVKHANIESSGVLVRKHCMMTTKMRVLGAQQQMLRLDFEAYTDSTAEEEKYFVSWLQAHIQAGLDGLIISDYQKGVLTPNLTQTLIHMAKKAGILVLVDPKGVDWLKYEGADFITPNIKEVAQCLGNNIENTNEDVVQAGMNIHEQYRVKHILVTRSEKGLTLIRDDGKVWNNAATAQEVFDVSGAGDTVAAVFMAAMVGHLSIQAGLLLSNVAAGIAVSKVGTYPIHQEDLLQWWQQHFARKNQNNHMSSWQEVAEKIKNWQRAGETVVFTNGCFDLVHRGHIVYLQEAALLGDHLVVGVNSDASVRRLKGKTRPFIKEEDRLLLLRSLRCVDEAVLFTEDTPEKVLSVLKPDILVKGGDYQRDEVLGKEFVKSVEIMPFSPGYSTTALVQKIYAVQQKERQEKQE